MNQPNRSTESLIAELQAATPGGAPDHPEPERLLAYRAGELAADEEAAVQDHLVACRTCTAVLLDLDELAAAAGEAAAGAQRGGAAAGLSGSPAGGTGGSGDAPERGAVDEAAPGASAAPASPADLATERAWRRLAPQLDLPSAHRRGRPAGRRPWRSPALAWAVAAALALVAVGLGVDRARLERAARAPAGEAALAPQANVPVLYLDPTTRAETAGEPLAVAAEPGALVVIATPEAEGELDEYRLILRTAAGQALAAVDGLMPSEYGTLRAVLPAPPAGEHVVALEGRAAGGAWQPAGSYPLWVSAASP